MTLVFRFPMPPNLTNRASGRSHWRYMAAEKKRFVAQCDALQQIGALPAPPEKPYMRVALASVMRLGHAMDDDNALARHKWIVDYLKTRGYIVNDSRQHIRWAGLPEQIVGRRQDYTVELTMAEEAVSRSEAT